MVQKIVIIGPESTGKSTLSEQLAAHYNATYVKEYAREYLLTHGTNYRFDDLLTIAQGQIQLEENALANINTATQNGQPKLIIDTDMYVMKVWCEFVFNNCHHFILNQIVQRKYHLYLLCNIDLPWVKDALREYPDLITREKLYHHYKDILINQQVPWVEITGNYQQRLQLAINTIDSL
jgi:NadR type nicotinamide-nucleotide adenylyltransferase